MNSLDILKTNKYKDRYPEDSSEYMRNKLDSLGFDVVEVPSESGVGSYSYGLYIELGGQRVAFSFGKGNTPEFARASAYGEMFERLQCEPVRIYQQFYSMYHREELGLHDFVVYPDEEKIYDLDDYIENDLYVKSLLNCGDSVVRKDIESVLKATHKTFGYIPLAKFTEATTGESTYINELLIRDKIMGSTGYCAGNTKYEALLQGLSEIAERYVKHKAVVERLSFPKLESYEIKKFRYSCDIINRINATGRYLIEVRDASMGGKLPVVSVILYDRARRGYTISFGAFPVFEVALERAINEIMQGTHISDVDTICKMVAYDVEREEYNHKGHTEYDVSMGEMFDFLKLLESDRYNLAIFPDEFLSENYSFNKVEWGNVLNKTNEEMFYELCNVLEKFMGDKVLYKDYSFLNMPAFSIICLKFTVDKKYKINGQYNSNIYDRGRLEDALFRKSKLDREELLEIYESEFCYSNLDLILGRPVKYNNLDENFYRAYMEFVKGDYVKSAALLRKGFPIMESNINKELHLDLWNALINYIGMKKTLMNNKDIESTLIKVYSPYIVSIVSNACRDHNTLANALFKDQYSELCVVDWENYYARLKAFKIIQKEKQ